MDLPYCLTVLLGGCFFNLVTNQVINSVLQLTKNRNKYICLNRIAKLGI